MIKPMRKAGRFFPSPPGRGARGEGIKIMILFFLFPLLLTACGFHPRGAMVQVPQKMQPVRLTGLQEYHPFMRELRHQLELSGAQLTGDPAQAGSLIRIRLHRDDRVFSVNADNHAVEYEYLFTLDFDVESPPGTRLNSERIQTRRIVYAPGGELLGRVREGERRERDVYSELAQRLIRRLSAL